VDRLIGGLRRPSFEAAADASAAEELRFSCETRCGEGREGSSEPSVLLSITKVLMDKLERLIKRENWSLEVLV